MGLSIVGADIHGDPMIMSYVMNSNKMSHGLKNVAKDELGWTWPTYRDIVGKGAKKVTLDRQPVELVAEYCSMDCIATWKLHEKFLNSFNPVQRNLYQNIELPVYRIIWEMESKGIQIDTKQLEALDVTMTTELESLLDQLHTYDSEWNPNSPPQTKKVLNRLGIRVDSTDKQALLPFVASEHVVGVLLQYKKMKKLHSTYVSPFGDSNVVHTTYNQVSMQEGELLGIRTGRLSSSNPNLQNIPAKKKGEIYGESLRKVFIPRTGKCFIDADYSQIEYRLLAHYSQEPTLVQSFLRGFDVHETTGKLLVPNNPDYRKIGKTLNFASIYGAQAGKIAYTAGCTEVEAQGFLDTYWQKLPKVAQWVSQVKMLAKAHGGVSTMSGRFIPLLDLKSSNKWKRLHAERAAVNYIIQGSAADILKVAMIELYKKGYTPLLQVHDELLFEVEPGEADVKLAEIKQVMENVVKLSVPLVVDIHKGGNWNEAKGD
jgi:DNA polymerase-1